MICDTCPHNRDGVCLPLRVKHPGKPCLIDVGIPMPDVQCPLNKWQRVLHKCDKCGSVRFNENGLSECPTCRPRSKPKMIAAPPITDAAVEPRHSDLAIISIATGQNAADVAKITFPRFEQYANFVGAEFIEVRDNRSRSYPLANKFRVGAITAKYRRTIYLDSDIWLRGDVGNMFEMFCQGRVWMHPDIEQFPIVNNWVSGQTAKISREQGVSLNPSRVYNSGVVVFDKEHRGIWSPPAKPFSADHVAEQFWVEHQAQNIGVGDLPWQYNCQWYWPAFRELEPQAKIVHLANCPHVERLTRFAALHRAGTGFS
jgi:hypothetical protein